MVGKTPIRCYCCGTVVIEDSNVLTYYVLTNDIRCPHCDRVAIAANRVTF